MPAVILLSDLALVSYVLQLSFVCSCRFLPTWKYITYEKKRQKTISNTDDKTTPIYKENKKETTNNTLLYVSLLIIFFIKPSVLYQTSCCKLTSCDLAPSISFGTSGCQKLTSRTLRAVSPSCNTSSEKPQSWAAGCGYVMLVKDS